MFQWSCQQSSLPTRTGKETPGDHGGEWRLSSTIIRWDLRWGLDSRISWRRSWWLRPKIFEIEIPCILLFLKRNKNSQNSSKIMHAPLVGAKCYPRPLPQATTFTHDSRPMTKDHKRHTRRVNMFFSVVCLLLLLLLLFFPVFVLFC